MCLAWLYRVLGMSDGPHDVYSAVDGAAGNDLEAMRDDDDGWEGSDWGDDEHSDNDPVGGTGSDKTSSEDDASGAEIAASESVSSDDELRVEVELGPLVSVAEGSSEDARHGAARIEKLAPPKAGLAPQAPNSPAPDGRAEEQADSAALLDTDFFQSVGITSEPSAVFAAKKPLATPRAAQQQQAATDERILDAFDMEELDQALDGPTGWDEDNAGPEDLDDLDLDKYLDS
mmetsp:Transcript_18938/g.54257  ORF Transcript_18938/g.54257 Transcript_18938/m.54257 type:complete len:231 (-) Transcript_18938:395-1087(-)